MAKNKIKKNNTKKVKVVKEKKIKKLKNKKSELSIRLSKKKKLTPKEIEAKQFKREFSRQANYFRFLKKVGNSASKDFKKAKQELKKGKTELAKKTIAKYQIMDINEWVKATNK